MASKKNPKIVLTEREKQVLQQMANGLLTKQIAQKFSVSVDTIESHRKNIYKKTNTRNAAEATSFGFRNRIIK